MKASTCAKNSAAIRQKEGRDKEIGNGNFAAALGYRVTIIEVEVIFKPSGCIRRRPKQKKES